MEQDTNLQNQAVDPQRNLVTKLINHYEPNVEVTDDYYKSISEKYQDVDTLVTKLINHYEPKAEVTTDYLNGLYSKYDVKKKEQTEPTQAVQTQQAAPTQAAPLPGLGGVSEEPTPSPSVGQLDVRTGTGALASIQPTPERKALSDYEKNQKALSDIDKQIASIGSSATAVGATGMPMMRRDVSSEELKSQRDRVRSKSDSLIPEARKVTDEIVSSEISGGKYQEFLTEDGTAVDPTKVGDLAREKALEYGLPDDGYFFDLVRNSIESNVESNRIKERVDKNFNDIMQEKHGMGVDDYVKSVVEKSADATGITKLVGERDLAIANVYDNISTLAKNEVEKIQVDRYGKTAEEYASDIRRQYESQISAINDRYSGLMVDGQFTGTQQQFEAYKADFESISNSAQEQINQIVSQEIKDVAAINAKYDLRYKRQADEIARMYVEKIDEKAKLVDPIIKKEIESAYKSAVGKVYEDENKDKKASEFYNVYSSFGPGAAIASFVVKPFTKSILDQTSTYLRSAGLQELSETAKLYAKSVDIGEFKLDNADDFLDPLNVLGATGQTIGGMVPTLVPSIAVGVATGGVGWLPTLAAGATGFVVESVGIAQDAYDDRFAATGSASEAEEARDKAWKAQTLILPAYALDNFPIFGKIAGGTAKRIALGALGEYGTELLQEYPQNVFEEVIRNDENLSEAMKYVSFDGFKRTASNLTPVLLIGAGGQASQISAENNIKNAAATLSAKMNIGNMTDSSLEQYMLYLTASKGSDFALAFVDAQLRTGNIAEDVAEKSTNAINNSKSFIDKTRNLKISNESKLALASFDLKIRNAKERVEAETDTMLKSVEETKLKQLEKQAGELATTGTTNYAVVSFKNNTFEILTPQELEVMTGNENFISSFSNGDIKVEMFGKNQKQMSDILNDKVKQEPVSETVPTEETKAQETAKAKERNSLIDKALAILEPIASAREELTVEQLAEVSEVLGEDLAGELISDQISKAPDAVDIYNLLDDNKVKIDDTKVTEQERLDTEKQGRKEEPGAVQEPGISKEEGAADTVLQEEEELVSTTEEELDAIDKELSDQGVIEGALTGRSRKRKVVKAVRNGIKAISKVLPNVKIKLYETQDEYEQATGRKGRGFYNFKDKSISINLESANTRTVAHEIFHAFLFDKISTNEEAASISAKLFLELNKVEGDNAKLVKELSEFASMYEEDGVGVMTEEMLAEYLGKVAENYDSLSARGKRAVREFVNSMLELIGKANPETKEFLPSRVSGNEVVDMLVGIGERVAAGEVIETEQIEGLFTPEITVEVSGTTKVTGREQLNPKEVKSKNVKGKKVGKGLSVKRVKGEQIKEGIDNISVKKVREASPELYMKNANILKEYDVVKGVKKFGEIKSLKQADEVYDIFVNEVSENLIYLHDKFNQDLLDYATLWYDGANQIAQELASKFDISLEQAAGIIAAQSPQKDWYQNVRLAELVLEQFKSNPVFTQEALDFQKEINERGFDKKTGEKLKKAKDRAAMLISALEPFVGQNLNDIPDAFKPYVVRTTQEISGNKDYDVISPDGRKVGLAKKNDGSNAKVAWGSYTEIGKSVAIYLNGSEKNISDQLGVMHKIRNFFNNIADPMSEDNDVTMDTHAVAAALLKPLSGKSKQVAQNFGTGTSNSGPLGIKGVYYAFADAYVKAAKEKGILPREMQSITWEAARGLFTDSYKNNKANVKEVNDIFKDYTNGKITKDEAREKVLEAAGGVNDPTWAGPILSELGKDSKKKADTGRIPGDERGVKRTEAKPRDRRRDTGDVSGVTENDIDFIEAEEGSLSDPPVGRDQKDYKPKKTQKAYKLFTKGPNGNIFPLFVDANTEVPVGTWIEAAFPDYRFTAPNGNMYVPSRATEGVKEAKATGDNIDIPNQEVRDMLIEAGFLPKGSNAKTIKAVAARPGWHAGDVPVATHIGKELTVNGKKYKYRGPAQAWAEIEVPADKDWQAIANDRADVKKDGTINVRTAHITNEIPFDGFYRYKTNPNMLGNWIISGQIKVNKLLSDSEISKINEESGVKDIPSLPQLMREEGITVSDLDKDTAKRLKEFYPNDFETLSKEAPKGRDQKIKATIDFKNRYGKYFSISKIFSNEKHLDNYISFMERKGNKEIGVEIGVDVPDVSPTQPFAGREQKNAPLFSGKNKNIIDLANKYIAKKGLAAPEDTEIRRLNTEYSKAMADVYESAKHTPLDEDVQKAYKALAKESKEQFEVLKNGGYIVELWDGANEPYKNSTEMVEDLKDNKHLYVFSTEEGFGETGITPQDRRENPMLADSGYKDVNGKKLLMNDLFRFVHDAFGHGKLGNSFGPVGEENAWYVHSQMFSPDARRAMTSETRGQNSWVNFGPQLRNKDGSLPKIGDKNYVPLSQRDFAPQKNFLFPDEYVFDRPNTQGRFEGRDQKVKVDKSTIKKNVVAAVDFIKKAALKTEDGVTLNIDGTRYDGGGLVVPISSMNVEQGTLKPSTVADFVEMNKGKLSNDTFKLGLYKFPKESTVSIDLSVIVPNENRKLALSVGKKLNQESLFDLDTGENIKTGGTGQNTVELTDEQAAELATSLLENKEPEFLGREQKTKEKKRGFLGRNIEKLKFASKLSESVFENPEAFYEPQVLAEIKEKAKYMSDSELIEAMSLDGLNSIMNISGSTNTNMAVLAAAELINRKLAAGQDVESVVLQLNKMGTAVGQLMRQFGELKKSTPAGYMLTVERLAEKNNIKLKEADRSKISRLVQAKTELINDLNEATNKRLDPNLSLNEQKALDKKIKEISNELYKVDSELNRFVQTKIPLKLTDTLIQIMQGNLLTTASLAVNILGNVSQLSLMFPVKFIASTFDSLRRFLIGGERTTSFSIPAYYYGAKSFAKTLPDAARILFWKGPRDDFNEMLKGEINNGLLGVRAWMVLMSKGGIPEPAKMSGFDKMLSMVSKEAGEKKFGAKANIALNLIIQGTFGVTADIMFRALQAGDIIFKRPYRDMSLYEIGKRKGLSGEKLKNTLKYPSKKELQMADEIAKEGTFQEDSALAMSSKLMTDAIVKAAEYLGSKIFAKNIAKLLARSQFPYVKTPANIASFTFKMNVPAIAFLASMNYLRQGDNRKAALNFGIGVTGSMISTVAIGLVANGLIQSMGDDEDPRERALKYSTFPPGTINKSALMRVLNYIKDGYNKGGKSEMGERLRQFYVGEIPEEITVPRSGEDEFMSYLKLGIPGFVMGVYAMEDKDTAKQKAVNPVKENFIESMMGGTLKLPQSIRFISQQSFLQGTSALLNALTGSEYETDRWLTNTFRAVSSIPLPNQLASIARAQRDYLPDYRDEDLSVQFKNVMDDKIFFLRKETPSDQIRVDLWGRKIAQTPDGADPYMYHLGLDPLRNTTAREDNLSFEIYELYKRTGDARSIPSMVDDNFLHTYKGEKRRFNMTVAQTNRLQGIVGSIRQIKAQKLVESPRWQVMDDEQRIDELSSIYRDAMKNSMVEKEKKIIAYNIALGLSENKD